jgi:membrane protease YdiL (CAAX protease family)
MLTAKPWKLETVVWLLLAIGACVCSVMLAAGLVERFHGNSKPDENSPLFLMTATLGVHGSILLMVWVFMRLGNIGWAEAFGFKVAGLTHAILLGVIVALLFLPIGNLLQTASVKVLSLLQFKAHDQQAVQTLKHASPGISRTYLIIYTVLMAPIVEEMLFRGILYPAIKQAGFPNLALWGTSLAFAFIHLSAPIFLPLTVLAFALTYLYEKTDNLLACIVAHSTFNTANLCIMFLGEHLARQAV